MAITYTWAVTGMKVLKSAGSLQDYVVNVQWTKTGTDDNGHTGTFIGATPFQPDPTQSSFVPFDQLTESVVLGWVQPIVVGMYQEHVDGVIAKQIADKVDPVTEQPLPWAPPQPDPVPPPVV